MDTNCIESKGHFSLFCGAEEEDGARKFSKKLFTSFLPLEPEPEVFPSEERSEDEETEWLPTPTLDLFGTLRDVPPPRAVREAGGGIERGFVCVRDEMESEEMCELDLLVRAEVLAGGGFERDWSSGETSERERVSPLPSELGRDEGPAASLSPCSH